MSVITHADESRGSKAHHTERVDAVGVNAYYL